MAKFTITVEDTPQGTKIVCPDTSKHKGEAAGTVRLIAAMTEATIRPEHKGPWKPRLVG